MIEIRIPLTVEILRRWNEIEPVLRRATERTEGCYEPEDVIPALYAGRSGLLFVEADSALLAVVVTELRTTPRQRVLDITFCAAKPGHGVPLSDWVPLLVERLEDIARNSGASLLWVGGRIGWARAAGFKLLGGMMARHVR